MSKRDRILLAAIAIVGVVGGLFWFVIKPARAEAGNLRGQVQQITGETDSLRDQISRLEQADKGSAARTAEGFRLAQAVPDRSATPGTVVQLERLADRAGVSLESIRTNTQTEYGSFAATEYEISVSGRFFDVDDFMYRLHRQVLLGDNDRPRVTGRLFATRNVQISVVGGGSGTAGGGKGSGRPDDVVATMTIMAFSAVAPTASPEDPAAASGVTASAATPKGATP
jgi:Type II secretion system (T2SS), protein M